MSNDKIVIPQTESNSFVEVNPVEQSIVIRGNSFIADPRNFYSELIRWAKEYKASTNKLKMEVTPGYYSTSNIQVFNAILKIIGTNNPGKVDLVFHIEAGEEEDMEETIYSLTFNTGIEPRTDYLS